jgi:antitoxin ParD1/3/4
VIEFYHEALHIEASSRVLAPLMPNYGRRGRSLIGLISFARILIYWQSLPMMLGWTRNPTIERTTVMPTRNVNLTDELDRFVARKIKSGRYENASEVVRAGLRTLEREEHQYEAKLAGLRAAIDEGDASGIAEGNVFARVRRTLKLPVSR